ncbi:response regulator [Streptomyces sp. NPDC048496]|uniref:response regulator n=1 Tax=Streptomyces sp. NPDC048496 TaxID=3365558 RepID=UPI003722B8A5
MVRRATTRTGRWHAALVFRLILTAGGINVAGEAADGAGAVEAVRRLRPDVVLTDIRPPDTDGPEAARHVLAQADPARPAQAVVPAYGTGLV